MKCHFWMECKYVEADTCVQVCKEVGILGFVEELFFFFFFFGGIQLDVFSLSLCLNLRLLVQISRLKFCTRLYEMNNWNCLNLTKRHFIAKKGDKSFLSKMFIFINLPFSFGKLIKTIMIFRRVTRGENCYYFVELLTRV